MSNDRDNQGGDSNPAQQASIESLSDKSIRAQVLSETLQHPLTLVPFAIAFVAFIYLVVFAIALWVITVLAVSGAASVASFVWRYIVRYNQEYSRKLQQATDMYNERSRQSQEAELENIRRSLEEGFSSIDSRQGLKALQGLVQEYEEIQPVLKERKGNQSLSMSHLPSMAEETYQEGLNVLQDALELMRSIHSSSREQMEKEISDLEREVRELEKDASHAERARIRKEMLQSYKDRLGLLNQQQTRVDQLLYHADRCEASLYRAKIELAALRADSSQSNVNTVTDSMRETIHQAKELQEEFRRLGL